MKFTEQELKNIEKQLSHPDGENGVEIAKKMNESNIKMTVSAIDSLNLFEGDKLLEIGHGNCGHLDKIINKTKNIEYIGLEISKTMKSEAERINQELILKNKVSFQIYDGVKIPFSNDYFDKIFTVNTIYFWKKPVEFINEIHRVLKTDGVFVLAFAQKEFMKNLPFVKDKFNLYDTESIELLVSQTNLKIAKIITKTESIKSKSGYFVNREYSVVKMSKI